MTAYRDKCCSCVDDLVALKATLDKKRIKLSWSMAFVLVGAFGVAWLSESWLRAHYRYIAEHPAPPPACVESVQWIAGNEQHKCEDDARLEVKVINNSTYALCVCGPKADAAVKP